MNSEGFDFGLMTFIVFGMIFFYLISNFDDIEGSYLFPFVEKIEVEAVVISSNLARKKSKSGSDLYKAEVSFSYKIKGEKYFSYQLDFYNKWSDDYEYEKGFVDYYVSGKKVTAFCKARDHKYCVLRPDINSKVSILFDLLFMLIFFGGTFLLAYNNYTEARKP
jgi:hypothetical protein